MEINGTRGVENSMMVGWLIYPKKEKKDRVGLSYKELKIKEVY